MLNSRFEESFRRLVERWEHHEHASRHGNIAELAVSRARLDRARLEAAQIRRLAS